MTQEEVGPESKKVIDNMAGGDPGVTRETVEEAGKANPEQAPGLPQEPPETDSSLHREEPRRDSAQG